MVIAAPPEYFLREDLIDMNHTLVQVVIGYMKAKKKTEQIGENNANAASGLIVRMMQY